MIDDSRAEIEHVDPDLMYSALRLTQTEKDVWDAFRAGQIIDLRPQEDLDLEGRSGSRQSEVRAEVITAILHSERGPGQIARLVLTGAHITGQLDLSYARIEFPLVLRECVFDEPIVLIEARLVALALDGCQFPGINARSLQVDGDLELVDVSSNRTVHLTGAHFHRDVRLSGAHLRHGEDQEFALAADHLVADGTVACDGDFEAAGTVTMAGARVNEAVRLNGAKITASGEWRIAFYGDGMTVGHDFNAQGLRAEGEVRLVDVSIVGTLELRGAKLSNTEGVALRLDRAEILSSLYCDNGFTAVGDVVAIGAYVKGSVYFNHAELGRRMPSSGTAEPTKTGVVLRLVRTKIDGDLGCWAGFIAHGTIDLSRSSVAGEFTLVGTELRGYPTAADLTNGRFTVIAISGDPPLGILDFTDAKADFFNDGAMYWRIADIILDGFEYRAIDVTRVTVSQRILWLRRAMAVSQRKNGGAGYLPQPYEQLAKAYQRSGNGRAAQRIAVAREDNHYRVLSWRAWPVKLGMLFYRITLGYGYRLRRAFLLLPILYFISVLIIHLAQKDNAFVAVDTHSEQIVVAAHCTSTYPCLSQWAYSVDWVVPIINLHQSEYWQPDAHSAIGHVTRDWLYATTVLGWAATTLLVGAFAGLIRKD